MLLDKGNGRLLVVKGASEEIIERCTHYEQQGNAEQISLDKTSRAQIHAEHIALEKDGFRVLGIAWREGTTMQWLSRLLFQQTAFRTGVCRTLFCLNLLPSFLVFQ